VKPIFIKPAIKTLSWPVLRARHYRRQKLREFGWWAAAIVFPAVGTFGALWALLGRLP